MEITSAPRVSVLAPLLLVREYLTQLGAQSGFELVAHYADADVFLANLLSDRPRVVVADLSDLPVDGDSSVGIRVLRTLRHQAGVRSLVLSRAGMPPAEVCYREGASGYLDVREASGQAIVRAIGALAQGERYLPFELLGNLTAETFDRDRMSPLVSSLSWRERQVLSYVAAGADNLKIAAMLHISERTVKAHVSRLYQKLGSENRTQLALLAPQIGIRPCTEV